MPLYMMPNPTIEGFTSYTELNSLFQWALQYKTVVEVGSWKGRSTHALLQSGATVFAVDHFKGSSTELEAQHKEAKTKDIHAIFQANVGMFPNLNVIRMDSVEAASYFKPKSIDMVFIDGGHLREEVAADIKAWLPVCKYLLCGHDVIMPGVYDALYDCRIGYKIASEGIIWYTEIQN